jgi:cardiolipin synthase (CMP-forming)
VRSWLRQIPNVITSLRILLVIPIALALLRGDLVTTMGLFFAAAASDAADGFLAKRFGWQTTLGAILDPAADKLLLATVFIVLAMLRLVPPWLMVAAVARDLVIVLGAIAYRLCIGPVTARPSFISKVNTLCQAFYILSVIGRAQFAFPPAWVVLALGALTFVTIVISGMDYVLRYGEAAIQDANARRPALPSSRRT